MRDKKRRSIVKAISWRATGTLDTLILSFLITREWKWAASIATLEVITKFILYYFHERIWDSIKFGRFEGPKDYQI